MSTKKAGRGPKKQHTITKSKYHNILMPKAKELTRNARTMKNIVLEVQHLLFCVMAHQPRAVA
jgi:hypothetical protein